MKTASSTFADSDIQEMVATRRDLHANPELGVPGNAHVGVVAERLRAAARARTGVGKTGVMATLPGAPRQDVLLRADMERCRSRRRTRPSIARERRSHARMRARLPHVDLLTVAKQLRRETSSFPARWKLCFQPAGGGRRRRRRDDQGRRARRPKPDAASVFTCGRTSTSARSASRGPMMAAVDEFTVTVTGTGAHAAMPHLGVDPVVCLAHIVTALQTTPAASDPFKQVVVSVTRLQAGPPSTSSRERVDERHREGVRRDVWKELPERFERIVRGVAQALGCRSRSSSSAQSADDQRSGDVRARAPPRRRRSSAPRTSSTTCVRWRRRLLRVLYRVPGCFIAVGSRNAARADVRHHHPRFDVDEGCLEIGAEIMLRTARRFLESSWRPAFARAAVAGVASCVERRRARRLVAARSLVSRRAVPPARGRARHRRRPDNPSRLDTLGVALLRLALRGCREGVPPRARAVSG